MDNVIYREVKPEDMSFVLSSWLKSFRQEGELVHHVPNSVYYKFHKQVIDRIFKRGAKVLLAVDKNDVNTIFGYSVTEGHVVHYVYVKKAFRRIGIFSELIDTSLEWDFTHWTNVCKVLTSKHPNLTYNPYFL